MLYFKYKNFFYIYVVWQKYSLKMQGGDKLNELKVLTVDQLFY